MQTCFQTNREQGHDVSHTIMIKKHTHAMVHTSREEARVIEISPNLIIVKDRIFYLLKPEKLDSGYFIFPLKK